MKQDAAIKERPILFSGPMVRAILDGRKTQTRRVVKADLPDNPTYKSNQRWGLVDGDFYFCGARCPYGQPGDRLWVRECHSYSVINYPSEVWYWAHGNPGYGDWTKPRPSIHMPRWASRILLEVTAVRVERLNDISEADAIAEGIRVLPLQDANDPGAWWESEPGQNQGRSPSHSFKKLWNEINGPGSWDLNPWIWVIEFKRI